MLELPLGYAALACHWDYRTLTLPGRYWAAAFAAVREWNGKLERTCDGLVEVLECWLCTALCVQRLGDRIDLSALGL